MDEQIKKDISKWCKEYRFSFTEAYNVYMIIKDINLLSFLAKSAISRGISLTECMDSYLGIKP